jgi:hypothetical protein
MNLISLLVGWYSNRVLLTFWNHFKSVNIKYVCTKTESQGEGFDSERWIKCCQWYSVTWQCEIYNWIIIFIIIIIIIDKTALFEPWPSLEDSVRFNPVFSSLYFAKIFFYRVRLSALHPTPNLEDQVPVFMSLSDRVPQLYLQAPGSLFVSFHESQGYGGSILTHLHTGRLNC